MKSNENVFYTDGHDIVVTDSELRVKKRWYSLSGITKHGLAILRPLKMPGFALLFFGALLEIAGAARAFPTNWLPGFHFYGVLVGTNKVAMILGFIMLVFGALWMWFMHERYAVTITTAEGERYVVVSRHKEYATQIVQALNEALFARLGGRSANSGRRKEFMVSGR